MKNLKNFNPYNHLILNGSLSPLELDSSGQIYHLPLGQKFVIKKLNQEKTRPYQYLNLLEKSMLLSLIKENGEKIIFEAWLEYIEDIPGLFGTPIYGMVRIPDINGVLKIWGCNWRDGSIWLNCSNQY